MGFEIVNKLGFTLQDCVPVFVDEIKWILGIKEQEKFHSLAIPDETTCCSRPVKITKANEIIEYTSYTDTESEYIEQSKNRIAQFVKVLNLHLEH